MVGLIAELNLVFQPIMIHSGAVLIEYLVGPLNALIKPIQDLTKDKRELRDNALRAVCHALNETRIYYRRREQGKERSLEIEEQLAKY